MFKKKKYIYFVSYSTQYKDGSTGVGRSEIKLNKKVIDGNIIKEWEDKLLMTMNAKHPEEFAKVIILNYILVK